MASQGVSISLKTVFSETVITSEVFNTLTLTRDQTQTGDPATSVIVVPSFREVTLTTVIVLSIPVTASPIATVSGSASQIPPNTSSFPLPFSPSTQHEPSTSSSSSQLEPSTSSSSGSSNTSRPIIIALATSLSLLAAVVIAFGIFRCRARRVTRAKALSSNSSQEHAERLGRSGPTSPSGVLGPELEDTQNSCLVTEQGDWSVGSVSPFVKHYHLPTSSPSLCIDTPTPMKAFAGPAGSQCADIEPILPGEEIAPDGMDYDCQDLGDARVSRITSIGRSTVPPPPYSQIGEHEA